MWLTENPLILNEEQNFWTSSWKLAQWVQFEFDAKLQAYSAQNMKTHEGPESQTNRIQIYVRRICKAQKFN